MTSSGLRAVVVASALGMLASSVAAQPEASDGGSPTAAPEPEPAETAETARAVVLFLVPDIAEDVQGELREALLAQFALIEAELVFERAQDAGSSLGERMADAQRRAAAHSAIAVFWIDEQTDGRWFVHMMDSARERIVVRPADAAGDRRGAAIEAVAVMVRESTRALLEGLPIPDAEPAPPPEPARPPPAVETAPAPPPSGMGEPRQRPLRLSAGYQGTDFADELPWRHGAVVGVAWFGFPPFYAGASYVFTPALVVESNVDFELQRMPAAVHAGYRQRWDGAALDVELGLVIEIQRRGAVRVEAGSEVDAHEPDTELIFALAPRLRGELAPVPAVSLFAALGLDVLLNNFRYVAEWVDAPDAPPRTLLHADDVRPVLELGVAFYP